jgi:DNA-binding GntR family transcriptional regulator
MSTGPVPASPAAPLVFQSKADAVYAELRHRILDGRLAPGSVINQGQLSQELGVSTTPLREAVRRLETEGFLSTVAHRDAMIAPLALEDFTALYDVREQLDVYAVRLAARLHDGADREAIEAAAAALSTPAGEALVLNRAFHAAIYRASHNPVLIALLDGLWDRSDRYRRLVGSLAQDEGVARQHQRLAKAVLGGKEQEAADLMSKHLRASRVEIERRLQDMVDRPA